MKKRNPLRETELFRERVRSYTDENGYFTAVLILRDNAREKRNREIAKILTAALRRIDALRD